MSRASLVGILLVLAAAPLHAQRPDSTQRRDSTVVRLTPITVTATRSATDVFDVAKPVSVLDRASIREGAANSVSDLFRDLPGLDVTGVGPTQARPMIRGQRGQRILLLSDGLRLNNTRRQQDFGEIPGLIDISSVDRVEVVRGPASVLYGSDAIGGVVNIITQRPRLSGLHGSLGYRYGTTLDRVSTLANEDQHRVAGSLGGRFGRLSFQARGSYRDADPYAAPDGQFGDISLALPTRVEDSGVQDDSFDGYLGYRLGSAQDVYVKFERYNSDSSGFGYVDPAAFSPTDPLIQIQYPYQRFNKVTAGYTGFGVGLPMADKVDLIGYYQTNERRLSIDINIPTGGAPGPDSVVIAQRNFTDIETFGGRLEAQKLVNDVVTLTYGVDFFRDRTRNRDTNTSATYFAAPPFPGGPTVFPDPTSTVPQVPNASFRSLGVFLQSEFELTRRATLTLGGRYQDVKAETRRTPGIMDAVIEATDRTVVGSANLIYGITDGLSLVSSAGRAFRSPNLIERFFNGPTPEGFGFQSPNETLEPETSFNVDLGARYRNRYLYVEAFVFQNTIFDGIRIQASGDTVSGLPEFQNVNVDELRARGVEAQGDLRLPVGLSVGGGFTYLDTKNVTEDQNSPIGDSFSSQITGFLRYQHPSDRFFGEYRVRHNGERDDAEIIAGNPIGATLPAFTVHSLRGGVTLFRSGPHAHRITFAVQNLTNALYAEFSNATFFRPEARRNLVVAYDVSF